MTDDRLPPPSGDRPPPSEVAEPVTPPPAGGGPPRRGADRTHPGVLELSAFLDGVLTLREATVVTEHLESCSACPGELDRLRSARQVLSVGGQPTAPAGAMESAIVAALASVPRTSWAPAAPAERALSEPSSPILAVASMTEMNGATGSSTGAPASLAEELPAPVSPDEDATAAVENAETLVVIGLGEDLGAAAITAGPLHNLLDEQRTPVGRLDESVPAAVEEDTPDAPHSQAPRTPWMPASLDVEDSRRRAIRRQRHVSFGARAAAAVMVVALVGGGAYLVVGSTINGSGGSSSAASTSLAQLPPAAGDTGTLHSPPTTLPKPKAVEQPPAGALVLQLRSTAGPVSCSEKTPIGVVFKDGTLQRVDPSPTKPAVMQVPGGSGVCIEVGAAFATAWSGDVIDVSVRAITGPDAPTSTASGVPVHLVFTLEPAAIADAATMSSALAGRLTVSVIGQGADLGTATVTKGSVVTLTASNFVATLLRELLLPHKAS